MVLLNGAQKRLLVAKKGLIKKNCLDERRENDRDGYDIVNILILPQKQKRRS
jgi:hypothetical protein